MARAARRGRAGLRCPLALRRDGRRARAAWVCSRSVLLLVGVGLAAARALWLRPALAVGSDRRARRLGAARRARLGLGDAGGDADRGAARRVAGRARGGAGRCRLSRTRRATRWPAVACDACARAWRGGRQRGASAGARARHTLWRLFRREREDPEPFYRLLAAEAAEDLDRRHGPLRGQTAARPRLRARLLHRRTARAAAPTVIPVDNDPAEMTYAGGAPPEGALIADAARAAARGRQRRRRLLLEHARAHARRAGGDRRARARACAPAAGATSPGPTGTRPGAGTT